MEYYSAVGKSKKKLIFQLLLLVTTIYKKIFTGEATM